MDDPSILTCRNMVGSMASAWKQVLSAHLSNDGKPSGKRGFRLFSDFKLDGSVCLLLDDRCSVSDRGARAKILHAQTNQITCSQFAINRQID